MSLILATIIFLFTLFVLSKDDFVLLRKNVSTQTIFDIAFFVGLIGLLCARLVYALSHPSVAYFNPFVFFIIPYFPGLSVVGLLLGGSVTLYLFAMRQKLPLGKLFDMFALSFLSSAGAFLTSEAVLLLIAKHFFPAGFAFGAAVIFFLIFFILQKLSQQFSWKDGFVALTAMLGSWIVLLLFEEISLGFRKLSVAFPYFVLLLLLLFASFLVRLLKRV